jgi:hypothetical protein
MRGGTGRLDADFVDLRGFSTVTTEADADTRPSGPVMAVVRIVADISRAPGGMA